MTGVQTCALPISGVEVAYGLSHDMGRRVPEHSQSIGIGGHDRLDAHVFVHRPGEVDKLAICPAADGVAGQDLGSRGPCRDFPDLSPRERDLRHRQG